MDRIRHGPELADALGDWATAAGPRYRLLADALSAAMDAGTLERGDRLPSERSFAVALALSRSTVVAAYEELRGRGLLASRRGSGTVVCSAPGHAVRRSDGRVVDGGAVALRQRFVDRPDKIISLGLAVEDGVPELGDELGELVRTELPELLADAGYHPRGLPSLTAAVADHYAGAGLPTDPSQVLITTGATQAIGLVAQLYLGRSAVVAVESPSWPGCLDIFRAAGARLVGVPMDDEGVRRDTLAAVLAEHRPDLVFLMPTFHNPTGTLMSATRRRQIAELADRFAVPVLEDIAYVAASDCALPPISSYGAGTAEILTVGGLAKTVWGGLRVGWVRGPSQLVDRLARLKALADLGSAVLDQALAARMLPRVDELAARRAEVRRSRLAEITELLHRHLPTWKWQAPDGGPALWIELPDGAQARSFAAIALRHGVEIVPGDVVDPSRASDSYIRVPFTFPPDTLRAVVARLTLGWNELSRHGPLQPPQLTVI